MSDSFCRSPTRSRKMNDGAAASVTGWSNLDRDTLAAIISFLSPRDVAALACTCRDARTGSRENTVWAPLLAHHYGLNMQVPDNVPLVNVFRTLYSAFCAGGGSGVAGASSSAAAASDATGTASRAAGAQALAASPAAAGAVPLEGLYTDGGMDMGDPAFWAGNVFQPNGWAIYCSRAGSNVHCVAQLKAVRADDPFLAAHRSELITLVSDVAWLLFLGRVPARNLQRLLAACSPRAWPLCERLRAAMRRSLKHWSTHGLERLLLQLVATYQVLRQGPADQQQHQAQAGGQAGGGGAGWAAAAAAAVGAGAGAGMFGGPAGGLAAMLHPELLLPDLLLAAVPHLGMQPQLPAEPPEEMEAAEAGAHVARTAAAGAGDREGVGAGRGGGAGPGGPPHQGVQHGQPPPPPLVPPPPLLSPRLAAVVRDLQGGRSLSGNRGLVGLGETGEGLQVWSRAASVFLSSPALEHTTAIVDGVVVSRTGEFTCPVACGALFLAHRSPAGTLQTPAAAADAADGGGGGAAKLGKSIAARVKYQKEQRRRRQRQRQAEDEEQQERVGEEFVGMVRQPYVQALSDMTSLAAVEAASAAGLLPPIAARRSCPDAGEWVEFARPPAAAQSKGPPAAGAVGSAAQASVVTLACSTTTAAAAGARAGRAGGTSGAGCSAGRDAAAAAADDAEGESGSEAISGGVLWPVVWFRFFPHDGLGDQGDQGMALPPVLLQPPPLDDPDLDLDAEEAPPNGAAAAGRESDGGDADTSSSWELEPIDRGLDLDGGGDGGDANGGDANGGRQARGDGGGGAAPAAAMLTHDNGGNGLRSGGSSRKDSEGGAAGEARDGWGGSRGGEGSSGPREDRSGSRSVGSRSSSGRSSEGEHEDGDIEGESGGGEDEGEEHGSSSNTTSSSSSSSDDDGGGADEWAPAPVNDTDTEEWENELDFLYGIEGQPYSYNATANRSYSDEEDELAEPVHPYNGDVDADGNPVTGGGGAGGPGPSSVHGGSGSRGAAAAGENAPAASRKATKPGTHPGSHHRSEGSRPPGSEPQSAAPGSGGAAASAGPSGGSADGAAATLYGSSGELLQGVTMMSWLSYLSRPNVAGVVLGLVADAAGVQALRHTFQDVQTALQPGATADGSGTTRRRAPQNAVWGGTTVVGLPSPVAAATTSAAAGPTAAAAGWRAAAPDGTCSAAAAVAVAAAAAAGAAAEPLAVLLPPEDSAEHAFEGMEPGSPLLHPPAAAPPQPLPPGAADAAAAAAAPRAPPSGHLCMPLVQRWSGNTVLLKLINPEDRTEEFGEEADTPPNIDVQFVALRGVTLALRAPLRLCGC